KKDDDSQFYEVK
ncbi:hypothetical protein BV202_01270B, partial [Haemophilus influenzae]